MTSSGPQLTVLGLEERREQAGGMLAVALLVVATLACALGSSVGFVLRGWVR